ncbi:RsbR, positive regulator of sigma-B [Minicystis rosea]|nr:RsbR, positive regulator of sigma-B [Minicystis rosea]
MQMLERLPGVAFCARMDPVTGQSRWLYVNRKAAEIYDIEEADLLADPNATLLRYHPEERARIEATIAQCVATGVPMNVSGRMTRRSGEVRWLETHANVEIEPDGSVLWYGQTLDVTARKDLEQSLAESEQARVKSEVLYRQVIDALPMGITVAGPNNELMLLNPAQERLIGGVTQKSGDLAGAYGVFKADGVTPLPMSESGMLRCMNGHSTEEEVIFRNPRLASEVRAHVVWTPLEDENGKVFAALGASQDITLQRRLENELRARNEELAQSEAGKAQLIERLRYSIDELSNPILEVWDDVLAMPIIGVVDSRRTSDMVQRLLGEVSRTQASFVIIDLTGVEIVDTKTADHLMKLMRKVEIVGARCVITGIRPAVAETLVDIGVDFGRLTMLRNLKHGLREALRSARRDRGSSRDIDADDRTNESALANPRAS